MSKKDVVLCVLIVAGSAIAAALSYIAQGTGYIKIDTPGTELRLRSGWFGNTTVISGDTPMAVLPRTYQSTYLCVSKKRGAEVWSIKGYGGWGQLANLNVEKNQTVNLKVGPPFVLKPDVAIRKGARPITIGLSLTGQAGEAYALNTVTKNGRPVKDLAIHIVDSNGVVLSQGNVEYG